MKYLLIWISGFFGATALYGILEWQPHYWRLPLTFSIGWLLYAVFIIIIDWRTREYDNEED